MAGCGVVVVLLVHKSLGASKNTGTSDALGSTLKLVVALLTTMEGSTRGLELLHGHGRQRGSLMVSGLVVVDLVDWDGGVDHVWLDSLLLDYRLDGLVDVVVNVLSTNGGSNTLAVGGFLDAPLISEAGLVLDKGSLSRIGVTVVELAVLDCSELGSVRLREDLAVIDWLDGAVVVILVNLLVDGSVDLLVYVRLHDLVMHSGSNCLVYGGVMVTRPGHELGDCCLCLVHCECVVG